MSSKILISKSAFKALRLIEEKKVLEQVVKRVEALKESPERQGKSLLGELKDYRSLYSAKERYRIIYRVKQKEVFIYAFIEEIRKQRDNRDIYSLLKKLINKGLLE